MFNPNKIKAIKNRNSSSVVLKKSETWEGYDFYLPTGFEDFPLDDFALTKKLFFRTYRTYRKFIDAKRKNVENTKGKPKGNSEIVDDIFEETPEGYRFNVKDSETPAFFQKLSMLDSILDRYNELEILSLHNKVSRTHEVEYSRIDKYMHKAIFLPNNVIYIEEMDLPRKIVKDASTELVELFCYLYTEIQKELEIESESPRALALAQNFKENRLTPDNSLFALDSYEDTIFTLKQTLSDIDDFTTYKDGEYWNLYEAIETFLFGENDGKWEIDRFSSIWEEMCYSYATRFFKQSIMVSDRFGKLYGDYKVRNALSVSMNFEKNENNLPFYRILRPDLITQLPSPNEGSNTNPPVAVIDYKYMPEMTFTNTPNDALKVAVTKQLYYELALQKNLGYSTVSNFWIPSFSANALSPVPNNSIKKSVKTHSYFFQNGIKVFKLDFMEVQKIYLEQ